MKNKITNYVISLYGIIADKIYIWHPESIDESFISQYAKSGYLKYNEEGYNNYGKDKIFVKLNKDKDNSLINLDNNIQYMKWKYTKSSKFIVFKETASTDIINDFIFDMFIFYANKLYNIILTDKNKLIKERQDKYQENSRPKDKDTDRNKSKNDDNTEELTSEQAYLNTINLLFEYLRFMETVLKRFLNRVNHSNDNEYYPINDTYDNVLDLDKLAIMLVSLFYREPKIFTTHKDYRTALSSFITKYKKYDYRKQNDLLTDRYNLILFSFFHVYIATASVKPKNEFDKLFYFFCILDINILLENEYYNSFMQECIKLFSILNIDKFIVNDKEDTLYGIFIGLENKIIKNGLTHHNRLNLYDYYEKLFNKFLNSYSNYVEEINATMHAFGVQRESGKYFNVSIKNVFTIPNINIAYFRDKIIYSPIKGKDNRIVIILQVYDSIQQSIKNILPEQKDVEIIIILYSYEQKQTDFVINLDGLESGQNDRCTFFWYDINDESLIKLSCKYTIKELISKYGLAYKCGTPKNKHDEVLYYPEYSRIHISYKNKTIIFLNYNKYLKCDNEFNADLTPDKIVLANSYTTALYSKGGICLYGGAMNVKEGPSTITNGKFELTINAKVDDKILFDKNDIDSLISYLHIPVTGEIIAGSVTYKQKKEMVDNKEQIVEYLIYKFNFTPYDKTLSLVGKISLSNKYFHKIKQQESKDSSDNDDVVHNYTKGIIINHIGILQGKTTRNIVINNGDLPLHYNFKSTILNDYQIDIDKDKQPQNSITTLSLETTAKDEGLNVVEGIQEKDYILWLYMDNDKKIYPLYNSNGIPAMGAEPLIQVPEAWKRSEIINKKMEVKIFPYSLFYKDALKIKELYSVEANKDSNEEDKSYRKQYINNIIKKIKNSSFDSEGNPLFDDSAILNFPEESKELTINSIEVLQQNYNSVKMYAKFNNPYHIDCNKIEWVIIYHKKQDYDKIINAILNDQKNNKILNFLKINRKLTNLKISAIPIDQNNNTNNSTDDTKSAEDILKESGAYYQAIKTIKGEVLEYNFDKTYILHSVLICAFNKGHFYGQPKLFEIQQPVSLFFNGKKLYIKNNIDNKTVYEFVARSGYSKSSLWAENSKNQIFAVDDPLYSKFSPMLNYIFKPKFYYDEHSLCVEEGEYYISIPETYIKQNTNNKNSKGSKENNDKSNENNYVDNAKDNSMGRNNKYIAFKPIYSNENNYIKDYKIHGGENYESTYGINLYNKYNEFINSFYKLIIQKNDDIYIKDKVAPIKLQVSYLLDIDLRANPSNPNGVKWQSQKSSTGCKDACDEILKSAGIERSGLRLLNYENIKINEGDKDTVSVFILAVEKYHEFKFKPGTSEVDMFGPEIIDDIKAKYSSFDETKQEIYLEPIPENLQYALEYIDSELEKGYPVLIGVDKRFDKRIKHNKRYNEPAYTTDHFVVIVGRKYDSNRVPEYIFYDVGTAHENKGASDENTLRVEGKFLKGTNYDGLSYFVTEVRRNVRYK